MTKSTQLILSMLTMMVFMASCSDDEEVNKEPSFENSFSFTVAEDINDAVVIGTLKAEDDKEGLSYSILSNDKGLFEINPKTGELSLASGKKLNYEQNRTHEIAVTASDGELSDDVGVTISVTDVLGDNVMSFFEKATLQSFEETGVQTITISLDKPVLVDDATVVVKVDAGGMVYNDDYTTTPDGSSGSFSVPVELGAKEATFKLTLVDDVVQEADETISFTVADGADSIVIASSSGTTTAFTVLNDDDGELFLVAEPVDSGLQMYTYNEINGIINKLGDPLRLAGQPIEDADEMEFANGKVYLVVEDTLYSAPLTGGDITKVLSFEEDTTNFPFYRGVYGLQASGNNLYIAFEFRSGGFSTRAAYLGSMDLTSEIATAPGKEYAGGSSSDIGMIGDDICFYPQFRLNDSNSPFLALDPSTTTVGDTIKVSLSTAMTDLGLSISDGISIGDLTKNATTIDAEGKVYLVSIDPATLEMDITGQLMIESRSDFDVRLSVLTTADLP